jgi:hypothetical protein
MKKMGKMIKNKYAAALILLASFAFLFSPAKAQETAQASTVADAQAEPNFKQDATFDKIDSSRFNNTAVVQVLNKTTAKTSILEIRIGEKIKFGQLTILAHRCWQAPLDQMPESKILVEVFEDKPAENSAEKLAGNSAENSKISTEKNAENAGPKRIFYGWLFASSPSISGLEHPIYDLTAIGCRNK